MKVREVSRAAFPADRTWFHGTKGITGPLRAIYLTDSAALADMYGTTLEFEIRPDAKVLNVQRVQWGPLAMVSMDSIGYLPKVIAAVADAGYDVVYDGSEFEQYRQLFIVNPQVLIQRPPMKITETQLRRIILEQVEEYQGEHSAPDSDGAPLYDLTGNGVYPADVYSSKAAMYYGDGADRGRDGTLFAIVHAYHNRPNKRIKIFRAVPKEKSRDEKIYELEQQLKHILKYGRVPPSVSTSMNHSKYYEYTRNKIADLENRPDVSVKVIDAINPGDWVTIERRYATEHGQSALNGEFRVLSKTVPARELYTDGNSIYEWGWNP